MKQRTVGMGNQADLVIVGISVGVALGILIAALAFYGIWWYRKRLYDKRRANERRVASSRREINGSDSSVGSGTSFSHSVNIDQLDLDNEAANCQPSWWTRQSKDRIISASGVPKYSYKDIQKGTQNFSTLLGEGSFGPVYRAKMATGEVAVKVLASNSKQGEREFQNEVVLLGRLHHRNLVNLLGYCVDKGQRMLIYEYMSNGSLQNLLYGEEGSLTWDERLQVALDVSHGIEYLHEGAVPPVIHRDLKSANILLDQSMRAKVADFGLSKEQVFDGRNSGLKGTYGYMDPAYISTNKFTVKSDIYSLGIVLFELITAIHPHQNLMEYINLAALSYDGVDDIIDKRLVGHNVDDVRRLASIARKCLHANPRKRPSIREVSQAVVKINQRRLVKDETMSFAGADFSHVVSRIETQHVELSNLAGIKEKPTEPVEFGNLAAHIDDTPTE